MKPSPLAFLCSSLTLCTVDEGEVMRGGGAASGDWSSCDPHARDRLRLCPLPPPRHESPFFRIDALRCPPSLWYGSNRKQGFSLSVTLFVIDGAFPDRVDPGVDSAARAAARAAFRSSSSARMANGLSFLAGAAAGGAAAGTSGACSSWMTGNPPVSVRLALRSIGPGSPSARCRPSSRRRLERCPPGRLKSGRSVATCTSCVSSCGGGGSRFAAPSVAGAGFR
mmetsp:Transcript_65763/g.161889  ORF Transcript_65763/g.161889 Transcript_65763/m.161889 type:complete len:224 (-) Transcript_65763:262-933(-)